MADNNVWDAMRQQAYSIFNPTSPLSSVSSPVSAALSFTNSNGNNGNFWSNLTGFLGDYGGDLLKGLGTLGGIYTGIQQNRLAKDALNQAKEQAAWERMSSIANLQRQAKVYNDALRDRLLNRSVQNTGSTTGWENEYAQRMMDENANI